MARARALAPALLAAGLAFAGSDPARAQQGDEGGGGPPFGGGDWAGQAAEYLRDELDLDDGQVEQVEGIMEESTREVFAKMGEMWSSGERPDPEAMRSAFEDVRLDISRKVREILTPAQEREFDALVDQFDRRTSRWEQQRRAWDDPSMLFEPPPIRKRILLEKAERALFLGPEETAVIMPYVEDVLDKRIALAEGRRNRRRDLRIAVDGGADAGEIEDRMDVIRSSERLERLELVAAQQALRELLTLQQEVRFVAMGILD